MGLISHVKRLRYVWAWRARYWWMDTRSGEYAQRMLFFLGVVVFVLQMIKVAVAATTAPPPGEPVKAIYWWVVQLIIILVAAAVSYSMRPKTQTPPPASGDAPTVEDGQSVKHHFGEVWVEDEFLLAWKQMGTIPIKTKGGKK